MKTNYIRKKNSVQKAKIYEHSTHLYKFYSFKFIEFKPKFFKFEGPQSLETIQRRYNYNNYSLHQSLKGILAGKVDTNLDRRIIFKIFNFNLSSKNSRYMTWTTVLVKFRSRKHLHISSKFNFKNDNFR